MSGEVSSPYISAIMLAYKKNIPIEAAQKQEEAKKSLCADKDLKPIREMLNHEYTEYLDRDEYKSVNDNLNGGYKGIGVKVSKSENKIYGFLPSISARCPYSCSTTSSTASMLLAWSRLSASSRVTPSGRFSLPTSTAATSTASCRLPRVIINSIRWPMVWWKNRAYSFKVVLRNVYARRIFCVD